MRAWQIYVPCTAHFRSCGRLVHMLCTARSRSCCVRRQSRYQRVVLGCGEGGYGVMWEAPRA